MRSEDWVRFVLSHSCAKCAHEWGTRIPRLRIGIRGTQFLPGSQGRGTGGTEFLPGLRIETGGTQFRESPSDFVCLGGRSGWLWEWSSI
jgi:hypothetical protein